MNDGSVGQPRQSQSAGERWCLFDTDKMTVEIVRVAYDISKTQAAMRKLGLADFLINSLPKGAKRPPCLA